MDPVVSARDITAPRGVFVLVLSSAAAFVSPSSSRLAARPSLVPHEGLRTYGPATPGRATVEACIRGVYRQHYGAELRAFAPALVGLHDAEGALLAAAGYRAGDPGPMFLERYLRAPVDRLLVQAGAGCAERRRIVEVGHLAALRPGAGRRLFAPLALHLAAQGFDWVVGTLTEELRRLFERLGIEPTPLGRADPALLGPDAALWGSYYDHRPMVLAGRIGPALRQLRTRADRPADPS
jgi:hypothetical protein